MLAGRCGVPHICARVITSEQSISRTNIKTDIVTDVDTSVRVGAHTHVSHQQWFPNVLKHQPRMGAVRRLAHDILRRIQKCISLRDGKFRDRLTIP